jgi:predicted ATPase
MPGVLPDRYDALVAAGEISRDAAQVAVVARLEALRQALAAPRHGGRRSPLGWLRRRHA